MRQIDEEYVQTGLVRFGYRHFVVLGRHSQQAAEASECAAEQGAFWAYHDLLYARATRGADGLKQSAADLGLDVAAFSACLDADRYSSLVRAETALTESLGVRGTPAFLINGRPLSGV